MISPETKLALYQLAFDYKKTRLWKYLRDTQLFGARLPDGQIAYCCVMGMMGEHIALGAYVGAEGMSTWYDMFHRGQCPDDAFVRLLTLGQSCVQCGFDDGEYATPEQQKEALFYAQKLGTSLDSPLRYPRFDLFVPMEYSRPLENEDQARVLICSLRAAIFVAKEYLGRRSSLRLMDVCAPGDRIPILTETGNGQYSISYDVLPDYSREHIPRPDPIDEVTLRRLKRCRLDGTWDCAFYSFPFPVENESYLIPYSPVAVQAGTLDFLAMFLVTESSTDINDIYAGFVRSMIQEDRRPGKIRVSEYDTRGRVFFPVLAKQLNIPLEIWNSLPELNYSLSRFNNEYVKDESMEERLASLCGMVLDLSVEELCDQPRDILGLLPVLLIEPSPVVTPEVREKAQRVMERLGPDRFPDLFPDLFYRI